MNDSDIEECSFTDEGRSVVASIAHCYVEASYDGGDYGSPDECRAVAKHEGFEKIGSGVGRDVFTVPSEYVTTDRACVAKLPRNLEGCTENQREVMSWERVSGDARRYLAPILDSDVAWLLMPHAQEEISAHQIEELQATFTDTGWACEDSNEAHNLAVLDGTPVIIDYGMGVYRTESGEVTPAAETDAADPGGD